MEQDLQGSVTECLMSPLWNHHVPWPRLVVGKSQAAVGPARAEAEVQRFSCQDQLTHGVYQEASHLMELRGYSVSKA